MSEVKIIVSATPGGPVQTTAQIAKLWLDYASEGGVRPTVVFVHNDTEVEVKRGDTVKMLTNRWAAKREK